MAVSIELWQHPVRPWNHGRYGVCVGDIVELCVKDAVLLVVIVFDACMEGDTEVDACTEGDTELDAWREGDTDVLCVRDILAWTDAVLEPLTEADAVLVSVGSTDDEGEKLLLIVELTVSVGSFDVDAVTEAVKLGETGLFVTDGVGVGEGMTSV